MQEGKSLWEIFLEAEKWPSLKKNAPKFQWFTDLIGRMKKLSETVPLTEFYETLLQESGYIEMLQAKKDNENKTKLENGFDLSDYDLRCLEYAKDYAVKLLSIDVNIKIDEMLDTAWKLFAKHFSKAETGIKQVFIDKYWPEQ